MLKKTLFSVGLICLFAACGTESDDPKSEPEVLCWSSWPWCHN